MPFLLAEAGGPAFDSAEVCHLLRVISFWALGFIAELSEPPSYCSKMRVNAGQIEGFLPLLR